MGKKKVVVTKETKSGRNVRFKDTGTGKEMNTSEFVKKIEKGEYSEYHVRKINNKKTPASNPDGSENNNLG